MTEMFWISVKKFSGVQDRMQIFDKESEVYKSLKKRYADLKVILTASGVRLTRIDRVKE